MSIPDDSLRFCEMFEGELLLELMLRFWKHPRAADPEFRNNLIERTADILKASSDGERLLDDVFPADVNFVAAAWYAEWMTLQASPQEIIGKERDQRREWLDAVREAIPSCFCSQDDLLE